MTRRQFIALSGIGVSGLVGADTLWWETLNPEVVELSASVQYLPERFVGYRIVHITDIHHSSTVPLSLVDTVAKMAASLRPDLIVITGDFVTSDRYQFVPGLPYAAPCIRALSGLHAPDGVFAVLGNHDNLTDGDIIADHLKGAGIRLLRDEGVRLKRAEESLWLAGVDDYLTGKNRATGLSRALEGRAAKETSLLLAHNPDQFSEFVEKGVSLAFCGHTHGGQVRFPVIGPVFVPSRYGGKYAYGMFQEKNTAMWVSKGVGTFLLPVRLLCRAEIACVTLRRA